MLFKKKINIKEVSGLTFYNVDLSYNDGIVVYLNGKEVFRNNLPAGQLNFDTPAEKRFEHNDRSFFVINRNELSIGENVLAVEVHNSNSSNDLKFGLKMFGNKPEENIIIAKGSRWHYWDGKMPEDKLWFGDSFDGLSWKLGYSKFGYGEGDEATVIGYGEDAENKHIAAYFRKDFVLEDPSKYLAYLLNLQADDGAVIYLNGEELICLMDMLQIQPRQNLG